MASKRKYEIGEFRRAIETVGASPKAIAEYLGCSRGTVYSYLRRFPELKAVYEQHRGGEVEERAQFPREAFVRAIHGSHGVKAVVAARVGCSRQTVDNALTRWPSLNEILDEEKSMLVSSAVSALVSDVADAESDGHQRAYMFVLRTIGKDEGFSERQEVTGADGAPLLSPEIVQMIEAQGLDVSEVVRQFEAMVRARAAQMQG